MSGTELVARDDTALAIRADQQTFTVEQVDALKRQIGGEDIPDAELAVFFHQAKRTGLDPFARQIYIIPRKNRKKNRTDYTIQTSIDGLRLIADRTGRYAGSDRPVFEEDGKDKCAIVTVWKIVQGQRVPYTAEAWWSEFVQTDYQGNPSNLWKTKPRLMLAKCAESLALRKAFPAEMSGVYTDDEMSQADTHATVSPINPELDAAVARHPASLAKTGAAVDTETGEIVDVVEPTLREQGYDDGKGTHPRSFGEEQWSGPSGEDPDQEAHKKRMAALHASLHEAWAIPKDFPDRKETEAAAKDALLASYHVESASDLDPETVSRIIDACKQDPARVREVCGLPSDWGAYEGDDAA